MEATAPYPEDLVLIPVLHLGNNPGTDKGSVWKRLTRTVGVGLQSP